jgi:mono/diheme cytochrome c family protein
MINNKLKGVYVVISLIFLVFFLLLILKENDPPYLSYQKEFKELLMQKAVSESDIADFQIRVRQRWIKNLDRADRCETCHLGVEDPRFKDSPQPFKTHPDVDMHPIGSFGCTVCHGGQGLATSIEESHGPTESWQQAIYKENFMENSCSLCHGANIKEQAPVLAKGREIFKEVGCRGCHKVKGIEKVEVGPPLKNIGEKVKKDWIYRWLRDPRGMISNAKMPDFKPTDQEAADMAGFLFFRTRSGHNNEKVGGSYERGKKIFSDSQCVSCHPVNGRGGNDGPDLGKISSKVHSEWLVGWLKNPKAWRADTRMPSFGFTAQDIQDLTKYLLEEFVERTLKKATIEEQLKTLEAANVVKGKELIINFGCTGCHEIDEVEDRGETGLELTTVGDVHRSKIDFGTLQGAHKDRTVPNWLYNKMKKPRSVGHDPKMPDFDFSDREAEALTTYLLSLTADEVPNIYKLPLGKPPSNYSPQGEFGKIINKYQCFTCHRIMGKGADHGPDLTPEGSRIQKGWLQRFLKKPYTIRPSAHEQMPNFRLSNTEIESIYSYFRTTLVDDRVENLFETMEKRDRDDSSVETGRKLYNEKYACNACHRLNSKGGAIGPDLTEVGARLRPEWIAYHLRDPKTFVLNSSEPGFDLTDNEIRDLTAFLMDQKEKK